MAYTGTFGVSGNSGVKHPIVKSNQLEDGEQGITFMDEHGNEQIIVIQREAYEEFIKNEAVRLFKEDCLKRPQSS